MAKKKISKYLSIEASEDESDIESEDLDNVVDRTPVSNFVDIAAKLEEKYATVEKELDEEDNFDMDETVEEGLMQSQLIPKNYSPRLFLVRVKRGAEKEIALRIIHNKPNVCSIVAKDGLKGYIYIEAFQKQSVLDSFGKTRGINKNKISIVPQEEMIEALTYKNNYRNVEFGRIRKGKYKGDLAQVIDTEGDMIKIRIIPRINSVKKLFNPLEYKDEAIKQDKDTFIYRRDIYVNGYLEKEVLRTTVDLEVEPNFEELESFNVRKKFESDEKVKVTRGELIGTQGIVQSSLGNIITIYDKDNDRKYEVQADFCDRYFNIGEEVCINNENGVITNIKNNLYYIAIKNFSEEIKATTDQIKKPIPVFREFKKKEAPKQIFRRDNLINKQVTIKKGKYKGYKGIVKDVYMNKCRIQVNSNLKYISVQKDDLSEDHSDVQKQYTPLNEDYTPKTRMYKSIAHKTPAYEMNTFKSSDYDWSDKKDSYEDLRENSLEESMLKQDGGNYKGAIIYVGNNTYEVQGLREGKFITKEGEFDSDMVKYAKPNQSEEVYIMQGEHKGSIGNILTINDNSCTVKLVDGSLKNINYDFVCKKMFK